MKTDLFHYTNSHPDNNFDSREIMDVLNTMTREEAIDWLMSNDFNGIYSDADCIVEGLEPMTEAGAKMLCLVQLMEDATPKEPVTHVSEPKSDYILGNEAKELLTKILNSKDEATEKYPAPFVKGYFQDETHWYTAFDNTTGHCNVEGFLTMVDALRWLDNSTLLPSA